MQVALSFQSDLPRRAASRWARPPSSFRRIPTYVITIPQRYRRIHRPTDGQTDDLPRQYRTLRLASRGKNVKLFFEPQCIGLGYG